MRAVAAGCSGGRRGAAGSGAPALARHCAVPVRRGWETGAGERHGHNQKCRVTKTILLSGVVGRELARRAGEGLNGTRQRADMADMVHGTWYMVQGRQRSAKNTHSGA